MSNEQDERLIVKPAEGRLVRHPRTGRPLHPDGQDVTSERGYFHRMLRVGDVVRVSAKPAQPQPQPKKEG